MVERFRVPPPPRLTGLASLGVAIGLSLLALVVQSAFRPLFEPMPFVLFLPAVGLAAWAGGVLPGAVAVAASSSFSWSFLAASASAERAGSAPLAVAVFVPAAAAIGALGALARAGFRERERANEILEESERRERARAEELHAIMDAVPAVVLIARDPAARTITGSRAAHELLRIPPGAELSKTGERPPPHYRVLKDGAELRPRDLPTQAAARRGERIRDAEYEIAFDDGTRRMLLGNAEPLFDEHGRSRGAVSAFIDVTKLSEAVRARDAFLSMASHELRTPLTALHLQLEAFLRARDPAGPAAEKGADAIRRQVVRLSDLVNTLLDVSRLNEGRLRMELERVDLAAVARDVVTRLGPESARARTPIHLDAPQPVGGRWDRLRLEQVTTNLVTNALKYGDGKPVSVRVEGDASTGRLIVEDHGIGIDVAERDRIFERFERGRGARGYGGFGLGLWISREIVTALGGRIEVESAPGSGATFRVELPLAGPASA